MCQRYCQNLQLQFFWTIRPIPVLEAADDGDEDPEVDLAPLLQQPDAVIYPPGKMIVLRNPDQAVSVGVSAPASAHGRRAEPGRIKIMIVTKIYRRKEERKNE